MLYYPPIHKEARKYISIATSIFFVACVIATIIGMFAAKFIMEANSEFTEWAATLAALLNAVIVAVMSAIYNFVATATTDLENHRTRIEHEDALIAKTFIIQFINAFSSMFFIAFGQPFMWNTKINGVNYVSRCAKSCLKQIQTTLSVLFFTNLSIGSVVALITPYINQKIKKMEEFADVGDHTDISLLERQFVLDEYELTMGPFFDYANYTLQFAYATMFISAYPLAIVLAFTYNYVMMRINTWSFCHLRKRPMPQAVEDIGTWYSILELLSYGAVFCSAGLVAFTSNVTENYMWAERIWIAACFVGGIFLAKYIISLSRIKVADDVQIQIERNKYVIDKIYNNVPDDNDFQIQKDVKKLAKAKYTIRINDDDPL
jgi:hypothetical protein